MDLTRFNRKYAWLLLVVLPVLAGAPAHSPATNPCPCPIGTTCGYLPIAEPIWCDVSQFCWCLSAELCSPSVAYVVDFTPFLPNVPSYPINCISEGCAGVCFIEDTSDCAYHYDCESAYPGGLRCKVTADCSSVYSHFSQRHGWWATSIECCNLFQ